MASASLGRLTLDLVAQIGQFIGPMTQAERKAKESTDKMGKAFSSFKDQMNESLSGSQIGSAIEGITGKLGVLRGGVLTATAAVAGMAVGGSVVAVAGLSAMAIEVAKSNVEMMQFATVANTSIESFQGLAGAAKTFGVTQEQLSDQLKDFNEKIGEFASVGSGGAMDFFEQIAVKTEGGAEGAKKLAVEMSKLDGVEALQLYVDKLEEAGVNQQQMSFYLESMGSDLTKIAPLLVDGGKLWNEYQTALEDAGVITGQAAMEQSMALAAQTESLQLQFGALKNQLAQAVMPALSSVIGYFLDGSGKGGQFAGIVDAVGIAAKGAAILIVGLAGGIKNIVTVVSGALKVLGNLGETVVNFWTAPTFKDKGMALVDGFVNNGKILVNTAKQVVDTSKNTYGTISNVVTAQTGKYDALTQSILNNQRAQQAWAKNNQGKGITSGVDQNKTLNPDAKKPKSNTKSKAEAEAERLRKEAERLEEARGKLAKDVLYDYGTEITRISADLTKELERINEASLARNSAGTGFAISESEKEKLITEAKSLSEARKKVFLLEFDKTKNSWLWTEEEKLAKSAEIDKARIQATRGMTQVERDLRIQSIDSVYRYEMNKLSENRMKEIQQATQNWGGIYAQINGGGDEYGLDQERFSRYDASQNVFDSKLADIEAQEQDPNADLQALAAQRETLWQEHNDRMIMIDQDYTRKKASLGLQSASDTLGGLADLMGGLLGEQSAGYKAMFAMSKAFAVAKVLMNAPETYSETYKSVSMIPMIGPYMAPVMAAGAVAVQLGQAAQIKSVNLTGMAHDGIDSVPKEGTWLLNKKERVVGPRLNQDLTNYLAGQKQRGGGVNVNINVPPGYTARERRSSNGDVTIDVVKQEIEQAFTRLGTQANSHESQMMQQGFMVERNRG
ncbi:phage tail tape measure protein [Acinetobacter baumannii]|uniref:phage tail tape measure protein n=1 Tax=Acinetobacter baumannii TaxID=470 RepID=UPI0022EACBE4|nr:phage tail tape measure protein [Acinetobacter baumannii]MDA3487166.1 phage tail tape measure protein [Acinetobacter baumannii]